MNLDAHFVQIQNNFQEEHVKNMCKSFATAASIQLIS